MNGPTNKVRIESIFIFFVGWIELISSKVRLYFKFISIFEDFHEILSPVLMFDVWCEKNVDALCHTIALNAETVNVLSGLHSNTHTDVRNIALFVYTSAGLWRVSNQISLHQLAQYVEHDHSIKSPNFDVNIGCLH